MRVAIVTVGSRGDVEPYIALGLGLQFGGHEVRLATHAEYEAAIRSRGVTVHT
ncbi:MAG: glycosyltransferase [Chloroflexi bacterium]|nr:glycosyltransferase [Chloroflexota bacterium]